MEEERARGNGDQPKRLVKQAAALTANAGSKTEGVVDETQGRTKVVLGGPGRKGDTVLRARAKR